MRPGSLWFADKIHFDFRNIRGQKQSMLFMFDVVTGGMRAAFESSKRDRASSFAQIVAQAGLAHRGYQVMVGTDNCGSMQLLRTEAH